MNDRLQELRVVRRNLASTFCIEYRQERNDARYFDGIYDVFERSER